jgi:hypothetical protein
MEWFANLQGAPGGFRFIIQPLIAIVLGIRDGHQDAMAGRPPYVLDILKGKESRKVRLAELRRQIGIPFAVAVVLDSILQYLVMRAWFLQTAIVMGTLLIAIPYVVARGLSNRFFMRGRR